MKLKIKKIIQATLLLGSVDLGLNTGRCLACPANAIPITAGASIQDAVDKAGENAAFCLKGGVHRLQVVRPLKGQSFEGEAHAILNGARIVTGFHKEGSIWAADHKGFYEQRSGYCVTGHETCDFPNRLLIDDRPLQRVLEKGSLQTGFFFVDNEAGKLFIADNPEGKTVEESLARFAFESFAADVSVKNLIVEKYASPAQMGAVNGRNGANWTIESSEIRLNSGAGVTLGSGGRIIRSNIHHNGQIGAVIVGRNVAFTGNLLWANNTSGFDSHWEGGGIKIAASESVIIADNYVHHNLGPGLWCDINCRDVTYEGNKVEYNQGAGIFHEISFEAVIRNNHLACNGLKDLGWYWGADIQIAASESVNVYNNTVATRDGGSAIVLIDQGRPRTPSLKYKTRNNNIHNNNIQFEGIGTTGGASDVREGDENYDIITTGGNVFDANIYRISEHSGGATFVWGHDTFGWNAFRELQKQEQSGRLNYLPQSGQNSIRCSAGNG